LIIDSSRALFGSTQNGGANDDGTVFELTPPLNNCKVAYNSSTAMCYSNFNPITCNGDPVCIATVNNDRVICLDAALLAFDSCTAAQPPTASAAWTETLLHGFTGKDGRLPTGGLISDASGALYGTTLGGGIYSKGAVFRLTPPPATAGTWSETVLFSFSGGKDGSFPLAGLLSDASGAFYGTTQSGGMYGQGTVFKLSPPGVAGSSWSEVILHSFTGAGDGAVPVSGLLSDASGALYGTTLEGGASGRGTVFKLVPSAATDGKWTEIVLHHFSSKDGANPFANLTQDTSGALYGTTLEGGVGGLGTVFRLTLPTTFAGVPGQANCIAQSISLLTQKYGGAAQAAAALGYANTTGLQNAVVTYCAG
jgi:uncharacterized repeat protein (TIGR03803 family)